MDVAEGEEGVLLVAGEDVRNAVAVAAPPRPARRPRTRFAPRRSPEESRGATRSRPPASAAARTTRASAPRLQPLQERRPCPSVCSSSRGFLLRRAPDPPAHLHAGFAGAGRRSDDPRDVSVTPRGSTDPRPVLDHLHCSRAALRLRTGWAPALVRPPLASRSDRLRVSVSTRGLHEPSRPVRHLPRALPRPSTRTLGARESNATSSSSNGSTGSTTTRPGFGEHHSGGFENHRLPRRSSSPRRRSGPGASGSGPGLVSLPLPSPLHESRTGSCSSTT